MVRRQIQLEENQYETLRRIAHRKRVSVSAVVRQAVAAGLRHGLDEDIPEVSGAEALLKLAGIARSGLRDLAREHDRYLDEDSDER